MRFIKIAVIVFLIASLGIYGAGVFREKQREDSTLPTLTSDREVLEISVNYEEPDLLEGLTAYDDWDGDLTANILVGEFSPFIDKGVCNLDYVVFDSANQAAKLRRQVVFTDYESPKLTLSEPLVFTAGNVQSAIRRIGAQDLLDGNISSMVKQVETTIDYRTEGDYTITVEVMNSFGDMESQKLPVHVIEPSHGALKIELAAPVVYIHQGDTFVPEAQVVALTDAYGDAFPVSLVQAQSGVQTDRPGCYEVHYVAENEKGLIGETWLTVIVRE